MSLRSSNRKGHISCTAGGSGIQVCREAQTACLKMLQVKVRTCDFRTLLVRERNQGPSKHKDSFVSSEFMGMLSGFLRQPPALRPSKASAHSGDKESDPNQTLPGICMAWSLPLSPAPPATMPLLCPTLTNRPAFNSS